MFHLLTLYERIWIFMMHLVFCCWDVVYTLPLHDYLCFGRGPPLQAEVQASELYDKKLARMVLRAGTKHSPILHHDIYFLKLLF